MNYPDGLPGYNPGNTKLSNILTFENLTDIETSQKIINRLFFIKSENIYYRYNVEDDTMVPAFTGSSSLNAGLGLNMDGNTINLDLDIYDMKLTKQNKLTAGNNIDLTSNIVATVENPTFEDIVITSNTFTNNNAITKKYVDDAINAIIFPDFPKRNGIYELGKIYTFQIYIRNSGTGDLLPFANVNGYFTFSIDGFCHVSFNDTLYMQPPFISPTNDPVEFNLPFELNAGTKPTVHESFGTETSYYTQIINNGFLSGNDTFGINTFIIDNTLSTSMMRAYKTPPATLPPNIVTSNITVSDVYGKTCQIRYSYSYMPKYPLVPINPHPI